MVDWGKGYITDIEYMDGYFVAQAPQMLALAAVFNSIEPPNLDGHFTYCELGCSRGLTSLILAAVNPKAVFHAVDFNPASIACAEARARAAGLDNITFHERSFETLTEPGAGLPMFDIIALHGVWSWVGPEQHRAIIAFLKSHLRPGGLVYVSYNALPAWNDRMPLQRLLREFAAMQHGTSDFAIGNAIAMVNRLAELNMIPARFRDEVKLLNEEATQRGLTYMAHEYLHMGWAPYYFADVARALGEAKLTYAGSTQLLKNFANLGLNQEQRALLSTIAAPELRETLKDFCINNRFRQDVYVRGARGMSEERRLSILNGLSFALVAPVPEVVEVVGPGGMVLRPDPIVYKRIFAALESKPHSVAELLSLPGLPSNHSVRPLDLVGTLFSTGHASLWRGPNPDAEDGAARLNEVLEEILALHGAAIAVPTLGLGLTFTPADYAIYRTLRRSETPDAPALAARLVNSWKQIGRHPLVDGKPVVDATEALAAVTRECTTKIAQWVPIWRTLGIVA